MQKRGAATVAVRPSIVSIATDLTIGERELHQPLAQRTGSLPVAKPAPVRPAVDPLVELEQHPVVRIVVRERNGPCLAPRSRGSQRLVQNRMSASVDN